MISTLYEQLGGEAAVSAAVDLFFLKVLDDKRIIHFFENINMDKQHAKQKALLILALFGGSNHRMGMDIDKAPIDLVTPSFDDTHFDAVIEHLGSTLKELGVSPELIEHITAIAEKILTNVLEH